METLLIHSALFAAKADSDKGVAVPIGVAIVAQLQLNGVKVVSGPRLRALMPSLKECVGGVEQAIAQEWPHRRHHHV